MCSGHIYSREAIVTYLLTKTKEYKDACLKYEAACAIEEEERQAEEEKEKLKDIERFHQMNASAARSSTEAHASEFSSTLKRKVSTETKEEGRKVLQRTSYWLSEFQPKHKKDHSHVEPPERPTSPMSGCPLKLKDLIPLELCRNNDDTKKRCICAVSGKTITTQAVVAIRGVVMLQDVYDKLAKPTMVCPVTGKKFKEKHVLQLQKAASGFAASGQVTAKIYRPTMT